ncbi:MAG: hypothetical protein WAM29_12360 [Methylocella sp.]
MAKSDVDRWIKSQLLQLMEARDERRLLKLQAQLAAAAIASASRSPFFCAFT